MTSFALWFQATRPKTLIASLSPVIIGSAAAHAYGHFTPLIFWITLAATLMIQITTNIANDYFDGLKGSDNALRVGPKRLTGSGTIDPGVMKNALFFSLIATALLASYLIWVGGFWIGVLALISILLALSYTAGPFPLAYIGLGEIFAFLFFGPVATAAVCFLQMGAWSPLGFAIGLGPGLFSAAILLANNLRDYESDRLANKKTICVRFGRHFGKRFFVTLLMLGNLSTLLFPFFAPLLMLPYTIWIARKASRGKQAEDFIPLLPQTARLLLLYTLLIIL
jgi:1,4-dihydroxy-2-naphthoate octaprenyltransferase